MVIALKTALVGTTNARPMAALVTAIGEQLAQHVPMDSFVMEKKLVMATEIALRERLLVLEGDNAILSATKRQIIVINPPQPCVTMASSALRLTDVMGLVPVWAQMTLVLEVPHARLFAMKQRTTATTLLGHRAMTGFTATVLRPAMEQGHV